MHSYTVFSNYQQVVAIRRPSLLYLRIILANAGLSADTDHLEHLELEFLGLHSGYITNIDGCGVATRAVTSTSLLAPDPLM